MKLLVCVQGEKKAFFQKKVLTRENTETYPVRKLKDCSRCSQQTRRAYDPATPLEVQKCPMSNLTEYYIGGNNHRWLSSCSYAPGMQRSSVLDARTVLCSGAWKAHGALGEAPSLDRSVRVLQDHANIRSCEYSFVGAFIWFLCL
jgi:hypothetical protein